MRLTKDIVRTVFARHPRPWKLTEDCESALDADGNEVLLLSEVEDEALLVASMEALNRLDTEDLGPDTEPSGEVV
jgi:hypothetical protein